MTISLDDAFLILAAAGIGLLLLPLTGKVARVARYVVGGGLLLLAAVQAYSALSVSA